MRDLLKHLRYTVLPPVFIVRIRNRTAVLMRGKLTRKVLAEFSTIAAEQAIEACTIFGVNGPGGVGLDFAGRVSPVDRQRFRNVWNVMR